jgi:hypothetical protein
MAVDLAALRRWSSDAGRVHLRLTGSLATRPGLVARLVVTTVPLLVRIRLQC